MRDVPGIQVTDSGQPGWAVSHSRRNRGGAAILVNSQEITDHYEVGTPLSLNPAMVERIEVMRAPVPCSMARKRSAAWLTSSPERRHRAPANPLWRAADSATDGYNSFASLYGNLDGWEYRLAGSK